METRQARLPEPQRRDLQMARPLSTVVADKATPLRFEQINDKARREDRDAGDQRAEVPRQTQPLGVHGDGAEDRPTTHRAQRPCDAADRAQGAGVHTRGGQEFSESTHAERTPPFVSPRAVQVTKPETVKIPRPPITGKPANSGRREVGHPAQAGRGTPKHA